MPLVSIIIPTYNIARYVEAAIDSGLAQTYSNIEIVVVDDGSTDNTPEILRKYGDKIRFFSRKQNKGITTTLNEGVEYAKGEYILFFDADDVLMPNAIQEAMDCLSKHSNIDFVYFRVFHFYDQEGIKNAYRYTMDYPPKLDGSDFPLLIKGDLFKFSQVLMKANVFRGEHAARLDTSLRYAGDWDLWLQLLAANRCGVFYDVPLFYCRIHEHGLSSSLSGKWGGKREGLLLLEKWKKIALERGSSPAEIEAMEESLKIKIWFNALGDARRAAIFQEVRSLGPNSSRVKRWYCAAAVFRALIPWRLANQLEIFYYHRKQRSVNSLEKPV